MTPKTAHEVAEEARREAHQAAEMHEHDTHGYCPRSIDACDCEPCKMHRAIDLAIAAARVETAEEMHKAFVDSLDEDGLSLCMEEIAARLRSELAAITDKGDKS